MAEDTLISRRWSVMREALDERQRKLWVAVEAKVLGRGEISAVATATGVSRSTIRVGLEPPRVSWRPGGVSQTVRVCSVS